MDRYLEAHHPERFGEIQACGRRLFFALPPLRFPVPEFHHIEEASEAWATTIDIRTV
jgi:hypothetical protein